MTHRGPFLETATRHVDGPLPPVPVRSGLPRGIPDRLRSTHHRTIHHLQSIPAAPEKGHFFVTQEGS